MSTKQVPVHSEFNSVLRECSVAALSELLFERTLTFAEIVELGEKCGLSGIEKDAKKAATGPLTFLVPTAQFVVSVSRVVE